MSNDETYDHRCREIFQACGFPEGGPRYAFLPWDAAFKLEVFDFAQSLALNNAGCPQVVALEGSTQGGAFEGCARFDMVVTALQPIAWPDLLKSRSNGMVVYSPNPSWFGQGQVVVSPGAQPLMVRFVIEVCEEADRAQISQIDFDFFTP